MSPSPERVAKKWKKLPKGWTQESVKKFWDSLTSRAPKHSVKRCIKEMEDKVGNPGAFCGGLADEMIPGWREKKAGQHSYYFTVLGSGPDSHWDAQRKLEKEVKRLGWSRVEIHDEAKKRMASREADRWREKQQG